VMADERSRVVTQFGFRGLQVPGQFAVSSRLANVNLRARCVHPQNKFFACRRLDLLRNVGKQKILPDCLRNNS